MRRACARLQTTAEGVYASFREAVARGRVDAGSGPEGWDGRAGERVVAALVGAGAAAALV